MARFYLTTSIAYVNGAPHIGHTLEFVQADAFVRWRKAEGDETYFLTGTDEHGAKIARAAEAEGVTPQALTDRNSARFRALKESLDLSWDEFIRTTDKERHWPNVEKVWRALVTKGDIYTKAYKGLYCVGHEAFVTEKDLVNGICRDHGAAPEAILEENYFFRLSKYAGEVKKRIESGELTIVPHGRAKEIVNFIDQGIEDVSFSRPRKDLSWGIPVPGDDTQTIYVWCDALVNYLAPAEWWPADVHMIGKDILRFHALYWPAMLLSADLPLPKALFVHGHITSGGQKMSKTLGNVADPADLVARYGTDPVRYYLLREIPPTDDGDFSEAKFRERYEGDLANGLGNFAARVSALTKKAGAERAEAPEAPVLDAIAEAKKAIRAKLGQYRFHEALAVLWELIAFGNRYVNEHKPWDKAVPEAEAKAAIGNALAILAEVATLLTPFMPATAAKIAKGEAGMLFPRLDMPASA
mgnify:FL=1